MPKKILVADDSITIQKVMAITFAEGDYELHTVSNGTDALAKAREIQPDLVIADVVMPGLDGYEVCQAIKQDGMTAGIPVILLRGTFEAYDEEKARAVGANGEVIKPFEGEALLNKVEEVIEEASKEQEYLSAPPETLMPASPTPLPLQAAPPAPPPAPEPIVKPDPETLDEEAVPITEEVEEPLDEPPPPETGTVALDDREVAEDDIVDDFASPANALDENEPLSEDIIESVVDEEGMALPVAPPPSGLTEEVVPNFSADLRAPAYYDAEAAAAPDPEEISVEEPAPEIHSTEPEEDESPEPIESAIEEVQEEVAAEPLPSQGGDTAVLEEIVEVEPVGLEEPGFEAEAIAEEEVESGEAVEAVAEDFLSPVEDATEQKYEETQETVSHEAPPIEAEDEEANLPEPVLPPDTPVEDLESEPEAGPMPYEASAEESEPGAPDGGEFDPMSRFRSGDTDTPAPVASPEQGIYEEEPDEEGPASAPVEIEADIEGDDEPGQVELGNLSDDNDYTYGLVQKVESFVDRESIEISEESGQAQSAGDDALLDRYQGDDDDDLPSPIVEDEPSEVSTLEEDTLVEAAGWDNEVEAVPDSVEPEEMAEPHAASIEYPEPEAHPVFEEESDYPMTEMAAEELGPEPQPVNEDDTDAIVSQAAEMEPVEPPESAPESWQPEPEAPREEVPRLEFTPPAEPASAEPEREPAPVASSEPASIPDENRLRILIEEAVRKVVEEMSAKSIERIAWEVVPELSEAIIRKELNDRLKLKESGGG